MAGKINLVEEQKLCELVCAYPVIYDKSNKGYKERDVVVNAWVEISQSLEFVNDGKMVLFLNFSKFSNFDVRI